MGGVWFQNIRWRGAGPEDREGWVKRKEINRNGILRSHPLLTGWLAATVNGKRYFQKILVLVLWHGRI
jgi:hypothetical protein